MNSEPEAAGASPPEGTHGRSFIGPAVFIITLLASLVFFWWFLIYDHGVPTAH